MVEAQVPYVLGALRVLDRPSVAAVDVRPDVLDLFDRELQAKLSRSVWNADTAGGACPYVVGGVSAPGADLPEAPVAVLLPVAGAVVGGALWAARRRRTA